MLANAGLPRNWATSAGMHGAADIVRCDITIGNGVIERISLSAPLDADIPSIDLGGSIVLPTFVDMHVHLDKGQIWQRTPNPDGSFAGALQATHNDRTSHWTADDIARRIDFSLRCAYAHGSCALRTHLDSLAPHDVITWDVFDDVQSSWAGRLDLQACSLFTLDIMDQDGAFEAVVKRTARSGGILGGVTFPMPDLPSRLARLFKCAENAGLNVDLHVDETLDRSVLAIEDVADAALLVGFSGRIVAGHCCSLAVQDEATVDRVIEKLIKARVSIVSLPMCNLYLQDRQSGRSPRHRGATLVQELRKAGVPVALASDNARDPFYAYGDLDPLEVMREGVRIAHLDHPIDAAALFVTQFPADIAGFDNRGRIAPGLPADLIVFAARTMNELLSRPHSDRLVIRRGLACETQVPDYCELDDLLGTPNA